MERSRLLRLTGASLKKPGSLVACLYVSTALGKQGHNKDDRRRGDEVNMGKLFPSQDALARDNRGKEAGEMTEYPMPLTTHEMAGSTD